MKNVKIKIYRTSISALICLILTLGIHYSYGQATIEDNTPSSGAFLGWDDTGNTALDIYQNNTLRTRFTSVNWTGLNGIAANNASRLHLGLNGNQQLNGGVTTPFSMLHLGADINNLLRRDWMNVGITLGASADIMHVGLLQRATAQSDDVQTDAVVAWGCNDDIFAPGSGPDNLRFLFITPTNAFPAQGGPPADGHEEQGRETMRITPMGNVGIGDFSSMPNGLDEQPTHRLDVDGTVRIRQMQTDEMDVIITGVLAENPGTLGDYVLNYSTVEDFIDDNDLCDWNVVNSGTDVATGYAGACVEGKVLVGAASAPLSNPKVYMTKDYAGTTLQSEANISGTNTNVAGAFHAKNSSITNIGLSATAKDISIINYGVQSLARDGNYNYAFHANARTGRYNYGLKAFATESNGGINYGVHGHARGLSEPLALNNVGVFGEADGPAGEYNFGGYFLACDGERGTIAVYGEVCDTVGDVAGYFVGPVQVSQPAISLSDESIKSDITDIENGLDIINQLNPKQYFFNTAAYNHLKLDNSKSYGFSAQEVQAVLPEIVEEFHHPAKYDTTGAEISPSEDLLGIQYQEFIAILTAGIKEQQGQIDEQAQTIDDLQTSLNNQNDLIAQMMDQMDALTQQVNNCCDGGGPVKDFNEQQGFYNEQSSPKGNVLNQNTPNPFRSQTTISYELETGGKVMLNIYDKNGKALVTLVEANQAPGSYRYEWDASGQPAGLYHYALYVDGELLVKKAIKLHE